MHPIYERRPKPARTLVFEDQPLSAAERVFAVVTAVMVVATAVLISLS